MKKYMLTLRKYMNKVLCIPRIESITQIDSIQKVIDQLNIGLIH